MLEHATYYIDSWLKPTGDCHESQRRRSNLSADEALPERFNIAAHLLAVNAERGDKLAYIDDTTRLTYGELDERVRRCAAGLLAPRAARARTAC